MSSLDDFLSSLFPEVPMMQNTQNAYDLMNNAEGILQHPVALSDFIEKLTNPLSAALVKNVTNQSQAQAAAAGLGQSPMLAYITQQALAPSNLAEQQLAEQAGMAGLTYQEPTYYPQGSLMTQAGSLGYGFGSNGSAGTGSGGGAGTSSGGGILGSIGNSVGNWLGRLFA